MSAIRENGNIYSVSFSEIINLLTLQELAQYLEYNSKLFQSSNLSAEQALISIDKLCIRLQEVRSDEEFQCLITKRQAW